MDIIYQTGRTWKQSPIAIPENPTAIVISNNNWDDFGYQTTFNAAVFKNKDLLYEFSLKIHFPDISYSAQYLDKLIADGWDGFFPPPNQNYASLPSDIFFYEVLIDTVGLEDARRILITLHDAGFIKNYGSEESVLAVEKIISTQAWTSSLTREAGAKKAFLDGWRVFETASPPKINDFSLNLPRRNGSTQPVNFSFNSDLLPYDINILIGPNGVGKSHCLKTLVEYWLGVGSGDSKNLSNHKPFNSHPNISKLILVSYSPFEEFTLDLESTQLKEKNAYRYFGFRYQIEEDGKYRIGINRNLPSQDSVFSLIKAFEDDSAFNFLDSWIDKVGTIKKILTSAIQFDTLALTVDEDFFTDEFDDIVIHAEKGYRYVIPKNYSHIERISSHIIKSEGVVFLKNGRRVLLSSGQRLFCYIVINVVGEIKRDSLVIIDEPELFLHPRLEVEFVGLLKEVNKAFNSCAILATHSLSIARETPAKCVHVFRDLEDGLDVSHPPFETFGGDMQRISTYVFGDDSFPKPFEAWLKEKMACAKDPKSLIDSLGPELNEELVIKILNYENTHGSQNQTS